MSDAQAKRDFAALHIALARRALGIPVELPDVDGPIPLFDESDELDAAITRHPAGGDAA
jgi:hypothetical protein